MNIQSNGHLNPGSFAEYIGYVIWAPKGEDNISSGTKVTYKVMIHAGQTLHKVAVTVTLKKKPCQTDFNCVLIQTMKACYVIFSIL